MRKLFWIFKAIEKPFLCAALLLPLSIPAFCQAIPPCAQPTITSVTPSTWVGGQTFNVVVTGTGFLNPTAHCNAIAFRTVFTTYVGTEALDFSAVSNTEITGTVTLPASEPTQTACFVAEDVDNDVVRQTSGGGSGACPSYPNGYGTVVPFPVSVCSIPTITSVTPNVWFAGQSPNITITGTGFITQALSDATGCPVSTVSVSTNDSFLLNISVPDDPNIVSTTQITATVSPNGRPHLPSRSAAFYGAAGATVAVTNVPPPAFPGTSAPPVGSATAPADVVGTTAIQWTSDPDGSSPIVSGTTQQAVVGQQIVLTGLPTAANFNGLPIPLTIPPPPAWTIGGAEGTNIGGYSPTTASASVTETVLTAPTLTTYWVYPGTYPVSYESCVESQSATPALDDCTTVTATFEVSGPPGVSVVASGQQFFIAPNQSQGTEIWGLKLKATVTSPAILPGSFTWAQKIPSLSSTGYGNDGTNSICTAGPGLDTGYPFATGLAAADGPKEPLDSIIIHREVDNTSFLTFLLWNPGTDSNSIPVPLGSIPWSISGDVVWNSASNTWVQNPGSNTPGTVAGTFSTTSPAYPEWMPPAITPTTLHCN